MNEKTNYSGHYTGQQTEPRPQGIVFRFGANHRSARFSPYMWLSHVDYYGRELKLDFGRYDVVVRFAATHSLDINSTFEAITRHECAEIWKKKVPSQLRSSRRKKLPRVLNRIVQDDDERNSPLVRVFAHIDDCLHRLADELVP